MKVLVTGGSGFVGSNLKKRKPEWNYPNSLECDLLKEHHIEKALHKYQPDVVVNLAAHVGGILANMNSPYAFFTKNMHMNMNVIDACVRNNVKLINLGTVCSYPKFCNIPFQENDLWNGFPEETNSPYGIAKKAALTLCEAAAKSYPNFKYNYIIPTNLYGPQDNMNLITSHVIPAMIQKIYIAKETNEDSVTFWGTGEASRDFLYVDDCIDGIIACAENDVPNTFFNLGTGDEWTIKDVALVISNYLDFTGKICWDNSKPDGQPRRCVSYEKAQQMIGWQPKTSFYQGLRNTVNAIYPHLKS